MALIFVEWIHIPCKLLLSLSTLHTVQQWSTFSCKIIFCWKINLTFPYSDTFWIYGKFEKKSISSFHSETGRPKVTDIAYITVALLYLIWLYSTIPVCMVLCKKPENNKLSMQHDIKKGRATDL